MAHTKTTEGGQEQASSELPIPKLENASAGSATSSVDTDALVEGILKRLDPILERKLQSTKDKRIARIERQVGIDELSELEELGAKIPPEAKTEIRLRNLERGNSSTQEQASSSPGNGDGLTAQYVSEVIQSNKLDANDAEVLEKLRGTYRSKDHFEAEMTKLALARATKQPPSPSGSTTLTSSSPKTGITEAEAEGKYAEKRVLMRNPTLNKAKIELIDKELVEAGYKID